jgi:hypothetical protein
MQLLYIQRCCCKAQQQQTCRTQPDVRLDATSAFQQTGNTKGIRAARGSATLLVLQRWLPLLAGRAASVLQPNCLRTTAIPLRPLLLSSLPHSG